jgi:hypothetical protein
MMDNELTNLWLEIRRENPELDSAEIIRIIQDKLDINYEEILRRIDKLLQVKLGF